MPNLVAAPQYSTIFFAYRFHLAFISHHAAHRLLRPCRRPATYHLHRPSLTTAHPLDTISRRKFATTYYRLLMFTSPSIACPVITAPGECPEVIGGALR